jgi:archaellum biogenesis ATPase FlaH
MLEIHLYTSHMKVRVHMRKILKELTEKVEIKDSNVFLIDV